MRETRRIISLALYSLAFCCPKCVWLFFSISFSFWDGSLAKADRKLSYSAMLLYVFCRRFELIDHQTYIRAPVHAIRGITHQINADTCLGYPLSRTSALRPRVKKGGWMQMTATGCKERAWTQMTATGCKERAWTQMTVKSGRSG